MMIDGEGGRQCGIHKNSVTRKSIRTNGWDYNQGSKMRVFERPWTEEEWAHEIEAGRVPQDTAMPTPLRNQAYPTPESGMAQIICEDMKYRRFIVDDGSHRTFAMQVPSFTFFFFFSFSFFFSCSSVVYCLLWLQEMIKEKHPMALEICARGILLLDADPVKDAKKTVFSSIITNVKQLELDKDFLSDKLGQIMLVRVL